MLGWSFTRKKRPRSAGKSGNVETTAKVTVPKEPLSASDAFTVAKSVLGWIASDTEKL